MNILLVIHHHMDPDKGAPGAVFRTGEAYQKKGHQVSYFSFDDLPHYLPEIGKIISFSSFVAAYIARLPQVDIVEASTGDAWLWRKLFHRRQTGTILATQSHGLEHRVHLECLEDAKQGYLQLSWKYPLYHGSLRLWEVSQSLREADIAFLLNHQDLDYAIYPIGVTPTKAHVIPNGISENFLNLPFSQTPMESGETIKIAQVGSYILRKGIRYSAEAMNSVLAKYPNVEMSFLGTISSVEEVHADFDPAIRNRIHVIPQYSNSQLPHLLKSHHIKLLPSLSEGFGIAIIEAMACGLVPVATMVQGPKEIISDGLDGYLIPPRDANAIEKALTKLIENRSCLDQMRRAAYATSQSYSWSSIADRKLALYNDLLSKKDCH